MNKQQGFTLLSVMILTTMTSIIVLSSLRDNFIQERLTGNYQKKMNARLVSEKGIFDTHKRVLAELASNPVTTLEQLINDTLGENNYITGRAQTDDMSYATRLGVNSNGLLELSSDGKRFEGANNTVALFRLRKGGAASTFGSAIIGCEGVGLGASGRIDSYNSDEGDYDASTASANSGVTTIHHDSDINLTGAADVWGSIAATGSINLGGSAKIYGDAHANHNIVIDAGPGSPDLPEGFDSDITVGGDVLAIGNVELMQNQVGGVIRTMGDLYLGSGSSTKVRNQDNNGLDVMYRGELTHRGNALPFQYYQNDVPYTDAMFNQSPNVPSVPEVDPNNLPEDHDYQDPATNCDPIGISTVVDEFKDATASDLLLTRGQTVYEVTPRGGQLVSGWESWMGEEPTALSSYSETLPSGELVNMLKVKDFTVNGGGFKVSGGDVYMLVDGDFTIGTSGTTVFEIEAGSSLTIYVTGKTTIKKPVISEQGMSDGGVPVFSIYSSYIGKDGVVIDATGSLYAAIYAPETDAKVAASGGLMGSIRAKTVSLSGDTGIHYDTRLGEVGNVTTCCGTTSLEFVGWRYL